MLLTGLTAEIRKAALQFTSTELHCRHWRWKILIQVRSGSGLPPRAAIGKANCDVSIADQESLVAGSQRSLPAGGDFSP
jgi:hypothetical protein